jgi:hypothetical protein
MEEDLMMRFRPNIVVDSAEPWDEDFWGELLISGTGDDDGGGGEPQENRLALTANCGRCASVNIDYNTGRPADGEAGKVLKKLMKDRRVDTGSKWSPIFGRYAFPLLHPTTTTTTTTVEHPQTPQVAVGDEVTVTKRINERSVWSWPKY